MFDAMGRGQKGRIFMSSCRPDELSIESQDLKHGVYTHYFLEALQKKKIRKLNDVHDYVWQKVREFTNEAMHPLLNTSEKEGALYIF